MFDLKRHELMEFIKRECNCCSDLKIWNLTKVSKVALKKLWSGICSIGCTIQYLFGHCRTSSSKMNLSNNRNFLSIQQIVLLNFVVCGLEICASAAFTYIPPMLLKAGIDEYYMSIIIGIGPFLGFFLVPWIGKSSDNCHSKFGRRRPYILGIGLLLLTSLIMVPYGEMFGTYAIGNTKLSKHLGIFVLIVGSVLLDFSSQAALTPCEALLSDASQVSNQTEKCFTIYSFMVSLGGCIGYLIAAVDWRTSPVGIYFGSQEKSTFTILIILFIVSLITTLIVADETPLRILQMDNVDSSCSSDIIIKNDLGYESDSDISIDEVHGDNTNHSSSKAKLLSQQTLHIPLTHLSFTSCKGMVYHILSQLYKKMPYNVKAIINPSTCIRRLALTNFFSWTAIMGFNLFYTDFMGQVIYGGDPNAAEDSDQRETFDAGVRMGSWGLFFHCCTAAVQACFIETLVTKYGMQYVYLFGMATFTFSMAVMVLVHNYIIVTLMASFTGIAYATLTTIPFMLVQKYHGEKKLFFSDLSSDKNLAHLGFGAHIAAIDSAYFLSQVVLSFLMSYTVYITGSSAVAYMVVACGAGALSFASTTQVIFDRKQMILYCERTAVT